MRSLVYSLAALLGRQGIEAVTCYSCNADLKGDMGDGDISCWTPRATASGNLAATGTCDSTTNGRCIETITFEDGWPTKISRGCDTNLKDIKDFSYDAVTCEDPTSALDITSFHGEDTVIAITHDNVCTYDCSNSDRCNTEFLLTDFNVCGQQEDYTSQWCDYTTGTWHCISGTYVNSLMSSGTLPGSTQPCGTDITTATVNTFTAITCVQCNSATDSTCISDTVATSCNDESYQSCYATSSVFYDRHTGAILHELVVKGCSMVSPTDKDGWVPDQCYFSEGAELTASLQGLSTVFEVQKDILDGDHDLWIEHVCVHRCGEGNCNGEVPNGVSTEAEETVYCAVYDSSSSSTVSQSYNMDAWLVACDAGTKGCYSKVTYLERPMNWYTRQGDGPDTHNDGRVYVMEQKRGCLDTTSPQVTEDMCTMEDFTASSKVSGVAVTKHLCQSSCLGSNCNNMNWPNRPKCLRSNMQTTETEMDHTIVMSCESPAEDMCYISTWNFLTPSSTYYRDRAGSYAFISDGTKDLGFETVSQRGCTISGDKSYNTGCSKEGTRFGNEYFESCNFTCSDHGCNFGSGYSSGFIKLASPILVLVALAFRGL